MDLDALLLHYFATDDPAAITVDALATGKERLGIDFGIEREPGRRFALWALMAGLDIAPLPADAFKDEPALRAAADAYLDAAWKLARD